MHSAIKKAADRTCISCDELNITCLDKNFAGEAIECPFCHHSFEGSLLSYHERTCNFKQSKYQTGQGPDPEVKSPDGINTKYQIDIVRNVSELISTALCSLNIDDKRTLVTKKHEINAQVKGLGKAKYWLFSSIIAWRQSSVAKENYDVFLNQPPVEQYRTFLLLSLGSGSSRNLILSIIHLLTLICLIPNQDDGVEGEGPPNWISDISLVYEVLGGRGSLFKSDVSCVLLRLGWRASHALRHSESQVLRECLQLPKLDKQHDIFDRYVHMWFYKSQLPDYAMAAALSRPQSCMIFMDHAEDIFQNILTLHQGRRFHDESRSLAAAAQETVKSFFRDGLKWSLKERSLENIIISFNISLDQLEVEEALKAAVALLRKMRLFFQCIPSDLYVDENPEQCILTFAELFSELSKLWRRIFFLVGK
ncbi:hypothetical protein BGW36DRAFT_359765 [Talaromyces proteolyticus]|uniref:Uncharacterized protein n=1 Tax=Talaromyces proteolyticus TaxID=1131652 RepID=A0AAD4KS51_9EURO|nr:uncharacterized protein BGW36DRAFT_359765 [Talaromyces proteolyticus]KAH8697999.1 hypothetical protein BGW36DRAFT_359765 [Talaromyces proteolyticus]